LCRNSLLRRTGNFIAITGNHLSDAGKGSRFAADDQSMKLRVGALEPEAMIPTSKVPA
jgi:hypothetical protein